MNYAFEDLSGGYCGGVPPLPIPNREVKPACADGTAMQCGRVGGRHFSYREALSSEMMRGLFSVSLNSKLVINLKMAKKAAGKIFNPNEIIKSEYW